MLSFFRRIIKSRVGVLVTLAALGIIALAFAVGDISNIRQSGSATPRGTEIVTVGDTAVTDTAFQSRLRNAYDSYREQDPTLTMVSFIEQGGLDGVLARIVNGMALDMFATQSGMVVSQKSIDAQIATNPSFLGFDGKFDQKKFDDFLKQAQTTPDEVRTEIRRGIVSQWLMAPTVGASLVPAQVALPYASLMLERRAGTVGVVPVTSVDAGPAPTDQQLAAWYTANRNRYLIPEQRMMRYALISPSAFAAAAKPTPDEIARAYQAAGNRFVATEQRTLGQVIVLDQGSANAIAAKVRGGTTLAAAATAAGLQATTLTKQTRAQLTTQFSADLANAAFSAARGAVVGPVRSPLGWHVLRVEAVEPVAGKTLAQATPELTTELTASKAMAALVAAQAKVDDAITDGATFDEIVTDNKLTALRTVPLIGNGIDVANPTAKPDPAMVRIVQAGFVAEVGENPQLVQTTAEGQFAIVALERVIPAAPRPLTLIRDRVLADYRSEKGMAAARTAAQAIVNKINGGMEVRAAFASSGLKMPAPQVIEASRAEITANRKQVPPHLALMFTMPAKKASVLEAPNRTGWIIVYLDQIQRGDARSNPALINQARAGLGKAVGAELGEQFVNAVNREVGVKKNTVALAKVRADLTGQGTPGE